MNNTMPVYNDPQDDFKIEIQRLDKTRSIAITGYKGKLQAVTIPPFIKGLPVTAIENWAFKGSTWLTSITLPESLVSIGEYAFEKCTGLTAVTLPEGLTAIRKFAFSGCSRLTGITIPAGLTAIGSRAFSGCTGLAGITVPEGNQAYTSMNGVLFDKAGTTLIWYPKGKQEKTYSVPEGVTQIESYAFEGCRRLTDITLPEGITVIGDWAFAECGFGDILFPEGLTAIGSCAFKMCTRLTGVTFPESLTAIGDYVFAECSNLETIVLSRQLRVGVGAFHHAPGQLTYRN